MAHFPLYVTEPAGREHKQNVAEERDVQEQSKVHGRAEQRPCGMVTRPSNCTAL